MYAKSKVGSALRLQTTGGEQQVSSRHRNAHTIGGGIPRTLPSRDLFGGQKFVVIIRHEQDDYRLQMTAARKLLLTK
jgi:hemin uptake protein HemP